MKIFRGIWKHVSAFWRGFCGIFGSQYPDVPFERIVVVTGIKSSRGYMKPFMKELQKHFPRAEVMLVQRYYLHNQEKIVGEMIDELVQVLQQDKKTIIFGHSFGGIVARGAISRLEQTDHIMLLATFGSPHSMEDFGVADAMTFHGVPAACSVPVLTFGGRADAVVPDEFSHLNGEVGHISLSCVHSAFIRTSRTRKEVLSAVMQYFMRKV